MSKENALFKIDREEKLYVYHCAGGYSCLGWDYAFRIASAVAEWIGDSTVAPLEANKGTEQGYRDYRLAILAGAEHARATGSRCEAELTTQLRGLDGKRVEIVDRHGETRRFRVGRSTRWLPIHLEIEGNDHGGGGVTGAPFRSVTVL